MMASTPRTIFTIHVFISQITAVLRAMTLFSLFLPHGSSNKPIIQLGFPFPFEDWIVLWDWLPKTKAGRLCDRITMVVNPAVEPSYRCNMFEFGLYLLTCGF